MRDVGQLFITGISGLVLTEEEKIFLADKNIGGVILFSHNYESPTQLAALNNSIQELNTEIPLFISVDNEGGRVFRFKKDFTHFPSMLALASLKSPKLIFDVHHIMASELKAVGVNMDFSPCCDVLINPQNKVIADRAFGTTAETVSSFISGAIRGLQNAGVMACAKHFPGHGGTLHDSHFDLPVVKTSWEEILQKEIPPFIKAARSKVSTIMMAHLLVETLDDKFPCSLSSKAYQVLRDELDFYDRPIVTDDMEMKAIADFFPTGEAALKALQAGCDLVIHRTFEKTVLAYQAVLEAVQQEKLEISQKIKRIQSLKHEYLKDINPIDMSSLQDLVGTPSAQKLLEEVTQKLQT